MSEEKKIIFKDYIQGEEAVKKFKSGNYGVTVKEIPLGNYLSKIEVTLTIPLKKGA